MKMYDSFGNIVNNTVYPDFSKTRYTNWDERRDIIIPMLYDEKANCCGCFACFTICPKNSIEMVEDAEGFLYPVVNLSKCIGCHRCEAVCPIKKQEKETRV